MSFFNHPESWWALLGLIVFGIALVSEKYSQKFLQQIDEYDRQSPQSSSATMTADQIDRRALWMRILSYGHLLRWPGIVLIVGSLLHRTFL